MQEQTVQGGKAKTYEIPIHRYFNRPHLPGYLHDVAQTDMDRKSAKRSFDPCRFEQHRAKILEDTGD